MTQNGSDKTVPPVPPIPVGLEDLVGMAAASEEFAEVLVDRRREAVAASGVALAPTEAAVLRAVDDATLARMITTCRARQSGVARRAFWARASAAVLLLVGVAGCEKKTNGGSRQPGAAPVPSMNPPAMDPPAMRSVPRSSIDAGVVREREGPQVTAGVRPPRPRPKRPSGVKTGISPEHRRKQKLEVDTGSRPD
jgi:hypothetical protein